MAEPRRVRHVLPPTGVQPKREWGLQTIAADPTRPRSVGRSCSQLKFPTTEHQVSSLHSFRGSKLLAKRRVSFSRWLVKKCEIRVVKNQVILYSGFPIHQFADFVRFLKNPVFWVRSFLSSVRSFFWPQLHHFWAQLDRFPVYLGLRWFESSISWKFYVGFHVKTNFQKLWKPQFSQLDKICAQLG